MSRRKALDLEMQEAKEIGCGNRLPREMALARQTEQQAPRLAKDVHTLVHWLSHDILALAGPALAGRQKLFDFIIAELRQREHLDAPAFVRCAERWRTSATICWHSPTYWIPNWLASHSHSMLQVASRRSNVVWN